MGQPFRRPEPHAQPMPTNRSLPLTFCCRHEQEIERAMTTQHHRVEQLLHRHSPLQTVLLIGAAVAIGAVVAVALFFWIQGA